MAQLPPLCQPLFMALIRRVPYEKKGLFRFRYYSPIRDLHYFEIKNKLITILVKTEWLKRTSENELKTKKLSSKKSWIKIIRSSLSFL